MKNVDEALKLHLQEWFEEISLDRPRPKPKGTIPKLSEKEAEEIQAVFDKFSELSLPARRRGRPWVLDMNESFHAFLFVNNQMNVFRKRNGIKRVPEKVRDAFIELALNTWYPKAVGGRVLEFLREKKKYI
jgi:hypothetical protein